MLQSKKKLLALLLFVVISLSVASAAYANGHFRTSREWWRSRQVVFY